MTEAQAQTLFKPGERAVGRVKGTPNELTRRVRDAIGAAFQGLGGVDYLIRVGEKDPRTFCALLSKLLPSKVQLDSASPILEALTELTDAQLAARTARALADAQRAGLAAPVVDVPAVQVIDVPAQAVDVSATDAVS